jgi:CRP-like cAMP-binding protein
VSILGNATGSRRSARSVEWGCDSLDVLPRSTRRALRLAADEVALWPGQVVLAAGSPVHWLFVVVSGELTLRDGDRDLRVLRQGSTYGALETIVPQRHAEAELVARDVSRVLTVPKRAYTALVATDPAFGEWVMRSLAAELVQPPAGSGPRLAEEPGRRGPGGETTQPPVGSGP